MKRKGFLYENICNINNIIQAFDEVCRNTKNKEKAYKYKELKCIYVYKIYNILVNRKYVVGPYNVFTIYEPKERRIVSQQMVDKIINHLVARYILMPALFPCLITQNVASRKGLGTKTGIELFKKYNNICKEKFGKYYILKLDISKYFASINHDILKEKLKKKIKDNEALKIVYDIIDSEANGISIGNMTSQIIAVFYLNDLDHYIKEILKIKWYIRYQDDMVLFHSSKEYLKECLEKIEKFINNEGLELNKKTRIYNSNNNYIFLGYSRKIKYCNYRNVKRKMKKARYLYNTNVISLNKIMSIYMNFTKLNE